MTSAVWIALGGWTGSTSSEAGGRVTESPTLSSAPWGKKIGGGKNTLGSVPIPTELDTDFEEGGCDGGRGGMVSFRGICGLLDNPL